MSVTPNPCCDETKNRGAYTRLTLPRNTYKYPHLPLYLCIFPCIFHLSQWAMVLFGPAPSTCVLDPSFSHFLCAFCPLVHPQPVLISPLPLLCPYCSQSSSIMKSHHCVISSIIQSSLLNHSSQNIVKKQNKKHSLPPPSPLPHVPLYSIHCHLVFIPTLLKLL